MRDTAEYSAVAINQHGTATSMATVTVKSQSWCLSTLINPAHLCARLSATNLDVFFLTGAAGAGELSHLGLGEGSRGR